MSLEFRKALGLKNSLEENQSMLGSMTSSFDFSDLLKDSKSLKKVSFATDLGILFADDCLSAIPLIKDNTIDTVFADPPFNLNKVYGSRSNDNLSEEDYLLWCQKWIDECIRVLKPGGSLFIYNIPKWNIMLGSYLHSQNMTFRHWIAIGMGNSLPIVGKLYPAHYGLLYYTKGKPKTFRKIRTPIETCRHCHGEIKDYGGHRKSMNPNGVSLKDIWMDINPVRHWKFKSKERRANSLSTKILDRVIEMSTIPGDIVLDPFGGSGTTFAVCEKKDRRWIGCEIDFGDVIAERLSNHSIQHHHNDDFVEEKGKSC